jgi:hypothetical protein
VRVPVRFRLVAQTVLVPLLVGSLVWGGLQPAGAATTDVPCPTFDAGQFTSRSTTINNSYNPLPTGLTFKYHGTTKGHALDDVSIVTRDTKVLDGVRTVVVDDRVFMAGRLIEETFDYFAQDNAGNVWYFGEDSTAFNTNGTTSSDGSWHAGENGALPGIVMEASPRVGDTYCQENVPGIAEDRAQVVATGQTLTLTSGTTYHNVVETKEFTPLEPGKVENKFYAPGVGLIKADAVQGGQEVIEFITSCASRC